MSVSGTQTQLSQGELSPGVAVRSKRTDKGRTQAQGINLLPLLLKWVRVAGILLTVWLVGYFGFSLTWVLIAELCYVGYAVYRGKKKAVASRSISLEEDEPVLARIDELPAWVYFPDTERSEWLNKIIQHMWPYVGDLVRDILRASVEPIINRNLPAKLTPFKFEDINLGHIPLRVGGVKVYVDNVKRDEIILDVDVTLASDAELKVSVRGLTAGIKDIMIQGTVRIVMRPLVNRIPIIGGLSFFFISQPSIDFDLTDVANVLDMPLLSTVLRTIVSDQVANYLVLPNKIPVKLIENIFEAQVQLLLPQGVLYFTVIEACDLKKADLGILGKGKSDPYCKITVGEHEFLTEVVKNTLSPYWNKSFEVVMRDCRSEVVKLEVMDKDDPGPDDYLGSAFVDIDGLPERGSIDTWLKLEDVKTGRVHVKATWFYLSNNLADLEKAKALKKNSEIESTAILVIHIDSAKDLPSSKKYLKEPSPYVRFELGNRETKTSVRQSSTNPKWEEEFQFLVNDPEVQDLTVEVLDGGNHDKKLGDRKVSLKKELFACDEMRVSRPFTLKNANRTCSLQMTLILRILTPEKPTSDEDLLPSEGDATDACKKAASLPEEGEHVTNSGGSVDEEPPVPVAEAGDGISSYEHSRTSSTASGSVEKMDTSGLRYRGIQARSDGRFGRIQLTVRYSGTGSRLAVVIHQCVNLIPCDADNLADSYVRVYLLPDRSNATKRKTQTRKNELNPTFDETFDWQMTKSDVLSRTLEVMVKNSVGPFSKKRVNMGVLHLKLSEVDDLSRAMTEWFDLHDPDSVEKS